MIYLPGGTAYILSVHLKVNWWRIPMCTKFAFRTKFLRCYNKATEIILRVYTDKLVSNEKVCVESVYIKRNSDWIIIASKNIFV